VKWPYTSIDVTIQDQLVESLEVFNGDESYTETWETKELKDGLLYVTGAKIDGTYDGKSAKGAVTLKHRISRGVPTYVTGIQVKRGRTTDKYALNDWKIETI
jgi:hypothetical protein